MAYKLLVLDIDGTIIGKNGTVSAADKKALKQAGEAGVTISLCTGRALQGCRKLLQELALDGYHTVHDGAQILNPDTGDLLFIDSIKPDMIKQLLLWTRPREMDIELYSATAYYSERENWTTRAHRDYFDIIPVITKYDSILKKETIIKMQTVVKNREEAEKVADLQKEFSGCFCFSPVKSPSFPDVDFVNILSPEVSKGKAIGKLAAHLVVKQGEIIAIGDGLNDISLITAAGLGIAMGTAPDELKKKASFITASVEDNGVAEAVKKFIL